ncbi:hypothetical protein IJL65_00815 [bacterium]|nr:hypothetical protein [bacterium]
MEIQACGVDEWYYENNYSSYLWTARDDLSSIGSYSVDYGSIYWNQKVYNNGASPVRCFMVANPVTVTFNSE